MAIRLQSKTNVTAPGGNYPYGRIKDDTGGNNGTPVNEAVYGDFHQFFARILDLGSVVGNDLPENSANGFQYIVALIAIIVAQATTLVSAEAALRTTADNTLQSNITAEAGTRGAADTTLQNNINAASAGLIRTIVNIGDWNMDVDPFVIIPHGIADHKKIRAISAIIRNDTDTQSQPLNKVENATFTTVQGGISSYNSVNVTLGRLLSGDFDTTAYDSTSFNRGWVIIDYAP